MIFSSTTSMNSLFDSTEDTITPVSLAMTPDVSTSNLNDFHSKSIVILVGLPATGKSTISELLTNYLNTYTLYKSKIFNCGKVRRETLKSEKFHDYQFFDPNNDLFKLKREFIAMQCLTEMIDELKDESINVGILDATNTTIERRGNLIHLIQEKMSNENFQLDNLIILDVQCSDNRLINYNIHAKTTNDDYKGHAYQQSIEDFNKRLENYRKAYEPITNEELTRYPLLSSYMVMKDGGKLFEYRNYKKSDLIKIISEFFNSFSHYEARLYHEKVDGF